MLVGGFVSDWKGLTPDWQDDGQCVHDETTAPSQQMLRIRGQSWLLQDDVANSGVRWSRAQYVPLSSNVHPIRRIDTRAGLPRQRKAW